MLTKNLTNLPLNTVKRLRRHGFVVLLLIIAGGTFSTWLLLQKAELFATATVEPANLPSDFPVGVDPRTKEIVELPNVEAYLASVVTPADIPQRTVSWRERLTATLALQPWYQNLASPLSRILVILPGERREEVVDNFGDILGWDDSERAGFSGLVGSSTPALPDGKYLPGRYVVTKDADPATVAALVNQKFTGHVTNRYQTAAELIDLSDTLIIASLIEREASDFHNMREVSGVIWNRLFLPMPLQLDATLQYVKGSEPTTPVWWPRVHPRDKFLDSDFNTYQNEGLPPAPIANPSVAAIIAALNPVATDCLYYFHDDAADYHCSVTYEEHVDKLRAIYGRGR